MLFRSLTTDHSLFAKWLSYGRIAEECATPFPYKNVITRAIGTSHEVQPEIAVSTFEPGDTFLLCSDGLSDVLTLEDIEKILERSSSLQLAGNRLIEKAKIKGSSDNITVLIIQHDAMSGFLASSDERGEAKSQAKRSNDESIAEGAMDEEET